MGIGTGLAALIVVAGIAGPAVAAETGKPGGAPDDAPATIAATVLPDPSASVAPQLRPRSRPARGASPVPAARTRAFRNWISAFRGRALSQGIEPAIFDVAFQGLHYDLDVIRRDRNQAEFTRPIWDYLDRAVSLERIENGKAVLRDHAELLDAIEERWGVEREIVVAIWGLESAYGAFRGKTDVIGALATLAHDGRRGRFFEAQLVAALRIVQSGDAGPRRMTGSWAGAMGHTQFIPTSYLAHAVDFDGDGRRDVWAEQPHDALASTAAYLARFDWQTGMPWGIEVVLREGFDYGLAGRRTRMLPSVWAEIGVSGIDGKAVPDHGPASILLPSGSNGAAFLIFGNFEVLERYNTADAYVIAVGHLADRLAGAGEIRAPWPRTDRALGFDERREMQRQLSARGFDTRGIDGKVGPRTIAAIRGFQRSRGMIPDGYASLRLLESLR